MLVNLAPAGDDLRLNLRRQAIDLLIQPFRPGAPGGRRSGVDGHCAEGEERQRDRE
jgi:hypothetical protein